jgi:hypothetical protein
MNRFFALIASTIAILSPCAALSGSCDSALVKSTYNSSANTKIDWRLADLVDQNTYEEIKHNGAGSATIYGVPVGANYEDYKNTIASYKQSTNQSLSYSQQVNVAWTGLDPNAPSAYRDCLRAEQLKTGLHAFVIAATTTNILVRINWNVPGFATTRIEIAGADSQMQRLFPGVVGNGEVTVAIPRPKAQIAVAINSVQPLGYSTEITFEPLPPPPPPIDSDQYPAVSKWYWISNVRTGWYLNVYGGTFETIRTPLDVTGTTPIHRWSLAKVGEPNIYEIRTESPLFVMGRWQGFAYLHDAIVVSNGGNINQRWQLERVGTNQYRIRVPASNYYLALGDRGSSPTDHFAMSEEEIGKAETWTFVPQGDLQ